jgi:hypothetical protein
VSSSIRQGALIFVLVAGLIGVADANAFLGRSPNQNATAALRAEAEQALLAELEVALGKGHRHATERRLKVIERMLSPIFGAVPKNENGKLDSAAAGYVLHRIFVQRHGWFVRALEPAGNGLAAWNSSSPASILEERVPEHVQDLFAKRLGDRGLGLEEIAILASTLEHLVHQESLDRLKVSYFALNYSQDDVLSTDEATNVLDMYMALYVFGYTDNDITDRTHQNAHIIHSNITSFYPNFPDTQRFLHETQQSVAPKRDYLYFNELENVIAEVGERYGQFNDIECRQFKDWLMAVEDPGVGGAGRVRIADFYGQALNNGKWQFSETIDYLRRLGALDESDPTNLRVIIPNYISASSNCLASSSYYSVCCLDECEGILGKLEQMVSAPEASPSTILNLIQAIPSATMPANRKLSPWLHERLEEVAKHHGGMVPLHGRLFLQWLHYAYPRECSFPHISGSIDPLSPRDATKAEGYVDNVIANETAMEAVCATSLPAKHRIPGSVADTVEESGMWSMNEELVVWRPAKEAQKPMWMRFSTPLVFVGAVLSLSGALVKSFQPALSAMQKGSSSKYYV